MSIHNINKYLKDFTVYINRQKGVNLHIESKVKSKAGDHEVFVALNDDFETLHLKLFVPFDRRMSAKIVVSSSEDDDVNIKIGNSRNVELEYDIDLISKIITAGVKEEEPIAYIKNRFSEVFTKEKVSQNENKILKRVKKDFTLKIEALDEMIKKANVKGAGIINWLKTPNNRIILRYLNKENEYYGSEVETSVHLYYAYMLKNKDRSTKVF